MKNRFINAILLLVLLIYVTGNAQATAPISPDIRALIFVKLSSPGDLTRFAATRLPMYALLGDGLLTGGNLEDQRILNKAGLSYEVVNPILGSGTYYLAEVKPGRPALDFNNYGQVLFKTTDGVVLQMDSKQIDTITMAGAELQLITLSPKPLPSAREEGAFPEVIVPDPLIQVMIDQVSTSQAMTYDRQLAGELPVQVDGEWYTIPTRQTYSGTPIQKTTSFVGQHMSNELGMEVDYHVWNSSTNPNVVGQIPGLVNPDDIYIIGAHIDDVSSTPGADDNASGSVATLLAADILSQYDWGCTLRFAFWTGEEQGLLGSAAYANRASQFGENILGYLNLDMISYNTTGSPNGIDLRYNSGMPPTLQLAQLFSDVVDAYDIDLIPDIGTSLGGGSDHSSFWNYGYTAILAIEDQGDFNPYYHGPGDTPAHIDQTYFANFVKASIGTFAHMSNCLIPSGLGHLDGHVSAASDSTPIQGALITAEGRSGHGFPATTDETGYYSRTLLTDIYTVTASAYSYLPLTIGGIEVTSGNVTTQDFALEAAPIYSVSGTVTENGTGIPLLAEIDFVGSFGSAAIVWTNPDSGFFQVVLPEDSYTMNVNAALHDSQQRVINLNQDQTQNFALEPLPCILLVDDDTNAPDNLPYYTAALNNLGYEYNLFETDGGAGPGYEDMLGYRMVLWFSGDAYGGTAGPDSTDETNLTSYLNNGGKLFLDSQDYLYDFGLTSFGQNYLGVASFSSDTGDATSITGRAGDPIGAGLGPYPLTYPSGFTDYGDIVNPGMGTSVAFKANNNPNNLDLDKDGGTWKTVFFGTSWVPLYNNNANNGRTVLQRVVDWFGGCVPPPSVSIEPDYSQKSGEPGLQVTHVFTVTNTGGTAENYQMTAGNATWPTVVFPSNTGLLAPEETSAVTVTVSIPAELDSTSDTFTLTADGSQGSSDSANGITIVYDVSILPSIQEKAGEPGMQVSYIYTVTNSGGISQDIQLNLDNDIHGWPTVLTPESTGLLNPGESANVTVTVSIPGIPEVISDTFRLEVNGVGGGHEYADGNTLADVNPAVLVVAPPDDGGRPTETVTYAFTVTNTGDYTDSFTLEASSGWGATLPGGDNTGLLGANESITIFVQVVIPAGTLSGATEITTLRATSDLLPDVFDAAYVTTRVWYASFIPVLLK